MNRKGFTLVELLAVLVILAIISLIIIPIVGDSITKSRKSAFETSAYQLIKAADIYFANYRLETGSKLTENKEFVIENGNFVGDKLSVNGELPKSGKVLITPSGEVALAINNGVYCITKETTDNKLTLNNLNGVCGLKNPIIIDRFDATYSYIKRTKSGDDFIETTVSEVRETVSVKVNDDEIINFFLIDDDDTSDTLTLVMTENLSGGTIQWYSESDNTYKALDFLDNLTSGWTHIDKKEYTYKAPDNSDFTRNARARFITRAEINKFGCNYDNSTCGLFLPQNDSVGFWTGDKDPSANREYAVIYLNSGKTSFQRVAAGNYSSLYAIRPVIEIPKHI